MSTCPMTWPRRCAWRACRYRRSASSLRRAIITAGAGYGHVRLAAPTMAARLEEIGSRLEDIEGRLAAGGL